MEENLEVVFSRKLALEREEKSVRSFECKFQRRLEHATEFDLLCCEGLAFEHPFVQRFFQHLITILVLVLGKDDICVAWFNTQVH